MTEKMLEVEERIALKELMESRGNVYAMLSRAYRTEVDEAFAQDMAQGFVFESADETLTTLARALSASLADDGEEALEHLAVTFDRVFFGMGPLTARHAFPYESVYTSDRGILMQDAYEAVVRTYRAERLAKDAAFTEPEDHLAVELAFMATLAQRAALFLGEGDEASDEAAEATIRQSLAFLQSHLLNWIDRFCADLSRSVAADGDDGFYAVLARFTEAFLAADAAELAAMVD